MSKRTHAKPQPPTDPKVETPPVDIQALARREAIERCDKAQRFVEDYLKAKGLRIQTVTQIFDNQIVPGWRVVLIAP